MFSACFHDFSTCVGGHMEVFQLMYWFCLDASLILEVITIRRFAFRPLSFKCIQVIAWNLVRYMCKIRVDVNIGGEGCDTIQAGYFIAIPMSQLIPKLKLNTCTTLVSKELFAYDVLVLVFTWRYFTYSMLGRY